ncbi:MAG: tyrosine-type recombinase/integrase [Micrococcales bacterium]|nr:tyrosine-type recombinase/integrase [Micrococcales bacterium]
MDACSRHSLTRLRAHREDQDAERELVGVGYSDHGLVFANVDGTPIYPEGVSRTFKEQAVAHGLPPIRLHDARHTWATLALQSGVYPKVVQERLGHASITITLQTYSHVIPSMHEDAAETVASMIRAAGDTKGGPLAAAR